MLILENIIQWAGVVDELEFAKSLLNWCKHGFPELGDSVGRGVRGVLAKVHCNINFNSLRPQVCIGYMVHSVELYRGEDVSLITLQ